MLAIYAYFEDKEAATKEAAIAQALNRIQGSIELSGGVRTYQDYYIEVYYATKYTYEIGNYETGDMEEVNGINRKELLYCIYPEEFACYFNN